MSIINIFRYISGFVRVRIEKGFTERFFNLCNLKGIPLWDVEYEAKGIFLKLYAADFKKLRKIREKSGVTIHIVEKKGLKFLLKRNSNRKGLIAGMIISIIFMFTMNMFLWSIEVTGTNSMSSEQIKEAAEKLGLHTGMFVPAFDEGEASRRAVNHFDGKVSWMAINIKGSRATIEVRDYIEKNELQQSREPCNFIADSDGILISTNTFSGEQKAFSGQSIKKGSLLISGVYENTDGSVSYIHSDGLFSALVNSNSEKSYPTKLQFLRKAQESEYYVAELLHMKLPLSYKALFRTDNEISYKSHLTCCDNELPFALRKTVTFDENQECYEAVPLIFCIDDFTLCEYNKFSMSRILKGNYDISVSKEEAYIGCSYKCIDFIGEKVEILKEN